MSQPSKPMSLNKTDYRKILKDAAWFFLVPLSFYLFQIQATIAQPNHLASFVDFIPSNATVIAIESWAIGQILNTVKKFIS